MPPSLYLFGPENSGKDLFIRHAFWCNSIATPVIRDGPRLQKFRIGASNVSMIRVSHKVEPGTPLFARYLRHCPAVIVVSPALLLDFEYISCLEAVVSGFVSSLERVKLLCV